MLTQDYAKSIRDDLDFNRYANLINSLGDSLNSRKDRFDKSDIIEQSMEVYSYGRFVWVDLEGRDHRDSKYGVDTECKYSTDVLYTAKMKKPKKVVTVKLKNSLGKNKGVTIDDPADYYIIAQQDAMAVISKDDIKPYLKSVPDGIEAHIPFDKLDIIFAPDDVQKSTTVDVDYKRVKAEAQRKLIESIKSNKSNK